MMNSDHISERSLITTSVEISIKDFSKTTEQVSKTSPNVTNSHQDFEINFFVSAFPFKKLNNEKGWLRVSVKETVQEGFLMPINSLLSWIVCIIDNEGNSRLPCSLEKNYRHKYLDRRFIQDRADEFLPNDVLTLRYDIYFSWKGLLISFDPLLRGQTMQRGSRSPLHDFFRQIPQTCVSHKNKTITVYDFTYKILTLPQFHEKRKMFGVYGLPPCSFPWLESESKEDSTDNLEHIWIFETYDDKFILNLDEGQKNVGALLLKSSSFIRRCVQAPMKEQYEKRINFSNVESKTFKIILYFLETWTISRCHMREIVEVYAFSHLYRLENLQQKCADHMVKNSVPQEIPELQKIADFHSDEYFLTQLFSHLFKYQNENLIQKDDKFNLDCYI